jgi:hypothetical protein
VQVKTTVKVLLLTVFLSAAIAARAHHSFSAVFDAESPVKVSGTVTKVEWMNPHAWFYVDVEDADGAVVNWAFELGSPNGLRRRGWSRDTVKVGDVISISGYRARDGSNRGNVASITLADGRELTGNSTRYK